ncbi:MAG: hypothetical protein MSIBF_03930 [Candidatus Altiarchaeales archaeon IMC4]|nr:MAG: hypothetical protein MSIBF_03930 [Candidatus Altiarchaeales archaeon IMC4]
MFKMKFVVRLFVAAVVALLVTSASAGEIKQVDKTPYMKDKYGLNISGGGYAPSAAYTAAAQEIGNVTEFWVEESRGTWNGWRQINATLSNKTNEIYVYVQMLDPVGNAVWWNGSSGYITQQDVNQILNEFLIIYTKERNTFGNESYAGPDNDTHLTILLLDIESDYANNRFPPNSSGTAGYFFGCDMYLNGTCTGASSNERKIIYIDTYPLIETGSGYDSGYNQTPDTNHSNAMWIGGINKSYHTMAHEFNHMIQFRYDSKEDTWVDEGFSEYAPAILGYGHSSWVGEFEDRPYRSLTNWDNQASHYGESYLWTLYLSEHYGGNNTIRDILQNNKTGIAGINDVLANHSTNFSQVFHNWTLANYIDNTSVNPFYGYSAINVSVKPRANKTSYPASGSSWLEVWGADYVRFANGNNGPLNVTFAGDSSNFSVSVIHYNGSAVSVQGMQLVNSAGSAVINKFKAADSAVLVVRCTANATGNVTYNYSATASSNNAPALAGGNVTPQAGNTSTVFNFTATYTDTDNDTPAYVNVTIGGASHPMDSFSSNYSTGVVYYYATTLSAGAHNYSFSASDGFNSNSTATFNLTVGRGIAYCQNCSDCTAKLNGDYSTVYLNASVSDYNGTCVTFGANDIVFDCQGNSINGTENIHSFGIYQKNRDRNIIKNCIIHKFGDGIRLMESSDNNVLNNNTISNNGIGVFIYFNCYNNNITNNLVDNNSGQGIYIATFSTNNRIINNTILDNDIGIYTSGDMTYIINNTVTNNSDNGIECFSNNNSITNNTVDNNNEYGMYLYQGSGNNLSDNIVSDNLIAGIYFSTSSDCILYSNTINNNFHGILTYSPLTNSTIKNNSIENNTYGINLWLSSGNLVDNNTLISNTVGIEFVISVNNTLIYNSITSNAIGISSQNSTSTINSNTVCGNTNLDFNSSDWFSSSGDNNTCTNVDGWNDTGTTGCTYSCPVTAQPNATEFGTTYGTTNFSAVSDLSNVTNMTLANANGRIQFPASYSVYAGGQDYDANVEIGAGFVSVNSSALHQTFNGSATLTLNNVTCPAAVYFRPGAFTSMEDIVNGGAVCDGTTDPSCENIACTDNTLTFTTSHFTGFAAAEIVNVTLNRGWNLMSMPVNKTKTAQEYLNETGCRVISKYKGGIQTHIKGASNFNFDVTPGAGYYAYCADNITKSETGLSVQNKTVPLSAGWNLVGSVPSTINNASTLRANISLSSCAAVAKYENDNGFVTYNGSAENDFNVYRGAGYFVYLTSGVNWTIN